MCGTFLVTYKSPRFVHVRTDFVPENISAENRGPSTCPKKTWYRVRQQLCILCVILSLKHDRSNFYMQLVRRNHIILCTYFISYDSIRELPDANNDGLLLIIIIIDIRCRINYLIYDNYNIDSRQWVEDMPSHHFFHVSHISCLHNWITYILYNE